MLYTDLWEGMAQPESPSLEQSRVREQIQDSLRHALRAETPERTNYYIRRALQYCVIQNEFR